MHVTRLYATPDGESHFEDVEIPLTKAHTIGTLSEPFETRTIMFRENPADYDNDWHNVPQRQYVILLNGTMEIETSDGEVRRFHGGDIILAEDTDGRGHRTRTVDGTVRRSVFVTLPDTDNRAI